MKIRHRNSPINNPIKNTVLNDFGLYMTSQQNYDERENVQVVIFTKEVVYKHIPDQHLELFMKCTCVYSLVFNNK